MPTRKPTKQRPLTFAGVKKIALSIPGVELGTSYGTPAFKMKGRLLARLLDDGETLAVRIDLLERELVLRAAPNVFFVTPHYENWPMVLVRIARIKPAHLRELLSEASRVNARPRK